MHKAAWWMRRGKRRRAWVSWSLLPLWAAGAISACDGGDGSEETGGCNGPISAATPWQGRRTLAAVNALGMAAFCGSQGEVRLYRSQCAGGVTSVGIHWPLLLLDWTFGPNGTLLGYRFITDAGACAFREFGDTMSCPPSEPATLTDCPAPCAAVLPAGSQTEAAVVAQECQRPYPHLAAGSDCGHHLRGYVDKGWRRWFFDVAGTVVGIRTTLDEVDGAGCVWIDQGSVPSCATAVDEWQTQPVTCPP